MPSATVRFKIVQHFGVLSEEDSGWTKEFNFVSWNDRDAKYDLRSWSPDKTRMGRGITMTNDECQSLHALLNHHFSPPNRTR
ncbi:PC4/YdbC family ssDNA-binding protein [Terrilactibacillus sp. S3-3]|nr:PC4/YdbC family ssDNA-binding protein [Terrilactibacillus sp. S3-3]